MHDHAPDGPPALEIDPSLEIPFEEQDVPDPLVGDHIGNCWLEWFSGNNRHPVIGQNMYRLLDGRFEQIGLSWLKHGFTALQQEECDDCPDPDPEP